MRLRNKKIFLIIMSILISINLIGCSSKVNSINNENTEDSKVIVSKEDVNKEFKNSIKQLLIDGKNLIKNLKKPGNSKEDAILSLNNFKDEIANTSMKFDEISKTAKTGDAKDLAEISKNLFSDLENSVSNIAQGITNNDGKMYIHGFASFLDALQNLKMYYVEHYKY